MSKCLVVGCSFTAGTGLNLEKNDPKLWVNQLCKHIGVDGVENLSHAGVNNDWIFLETVSELVKKNYDLVLVGWSVIPRFYFNVGLELYHTGANIKNTQVVNTNTKNYNVQYFQNLYKNLLEIYNDHWEILKLVKYVNTLIEIQESRGKQILFVNNLLPFPVNYFIKKDIKLPSDLSPFEQNMLSVETRDDQEIFDLYEMIHTHYETYNGIQEAYWLNLYNNFDSMKIDTVSEFDKHPGYASQNLYSDYLIDCCKKRKIK